MNLSFSRKVLWLKVSSTNRDPMVIARYYLECVENAAGKGERNASYNFNTRYPVVGCPLIVRADLGTENCRVAKVHIAFRMHHDDSVAGPKSFIYGPSTAKIVSILFVILWGGVYICLCREWSVGGLS